MKIKVEKKVDKLYRVAKGYMELNCNYHISPVLGDKVYKVKIEKYQDGLIIWKDGKNKFFKYNSSVEEIKKYIKYLDR